MIYHWRKIFLNLNFDSEMYFIIIVLWEVRNMRVHIFKGYREDYLSEENMFAHQYNIVFLGHGYSIFCF